MSRHVRLVLALIFIFTSIASPIVLAADHQSLAQNSKPQEGAYNFESKRGHTLEIDTVDKDGKPIQVTGAWVNFTDAEFNNNPALNVLAQNNNPDDPIPLFALESKKEEAEQYRQQLAEHHISADLVLVNDEAYALAERAQEELAAQADGAAAAGGQEVLTQSRSESKSFYIKPTLQEKTLGFIQAAFQAGVTHHMYASLGIGSLAVASAVVFRALVTANWSVNTRTVDKVFNLDLDVKNHPARSRTINLFKRFLVDIGLAEATRAMSGAYGAVHSVLSGAGQAEIWKTVTIGAAASYILLFTRLKTFNEEEARVVTPFINFSSFFPATVLMLLDFNKQDLGPIKLSHVVAHFGSFEITVTNLLLLTGYATTSFLISKNKAEVIAAARWNSEALAKMVSNSSKLWQQALDRLIRCRNALIDI